LRLFNFCSLLSDPEKPFRQARFERRADEFVAKPSIYRDLRTP
jgi:hypothetical protein